MKHEMIYLGEYFDDSKEEEKIKEFIRSYFSTSKIEVFTPKIEVFINNLEYSNY